MKSPTENASTLLLLAVTLFHLSSSPFTKVEESFNIQATHDIITYGVSFNNSSAFLKQNYDHVDFPGSVPRTFVGAVVLAGLAKLSQLIATVSPADDTQALVRGILGLLNVAALLSFRNAINRSFGKTTGNWYAVLQATQFHVMYYASRTLPNMYAFVLTTFALRNLVLATCIPAESAKYYRWTLFLMTYAGVVFRSELAVLVFTISAFIFTINTASLSTVIIPSGLGGLVMGLLTTVPIDSYFWQKFPQWPEWSGFYYNTILGQSSNWGTSPWYFYFVNALPRLLLNPLIYILLVPLAVTQPGTRSRSLALVTPLLGFVALYSFLPHKEWRFIIYIIPGLTAVASVGATWIWQRRSKSFFYRILTAAVVASILASFAISTTILAISSLNYPGAEAILRLRDIAQGEHGTVHVYADNLVCQSGLTRFLEQRTEQVGGQAKWVFDKTEDEKDLLNPVFWDQFDYALAEHAEKTIGKWEVADTVRGFGGVKVVRPGQTPDEGNVEVDPVTVFLQKSRFRDSKLLNTWKTLETTLREKVTKGWWVAIRLEPKLLILKRQRSPPNSMVAPDAEITQDTERDV